MIYYSIIIKGHVTYLTTYIIISSPYSFDMGEYMGSKCMDSDVEYVYLNNYYLEEKIFEANTTTYSNLQYQLIFISIT